MALRINHNISTLTALRKLDQTDREGRRTMERLATGLRINRASDDPSGLVISENLRAQIAGLQKAVENASSAANMIDTAEAALAEVQALLAKIRQSTVFAMNTGGASSEQIQAEQDAVDQAIEAIDRIAATTRFATRNLLSGESGFQVRSQASAILDLRPISLRFDERSSQTTYTLTVTSAAEQAMLSAIGSGTSAVASGGTVVLRLTGNRGTEETYLASGATLSAFREAVNIIRGDTGIYASGGMLYSEDYGSDAVIRIEQIGGTGRFTGAGGAVTGVGSHTDDYGQDVAADLNGATGRAKGNHINLVSPFFTGSIDLRAGTGNGTYQFTVRNSGLAFQLSNGISSNDQATIGIPSLYAPDLGMAKRTTGGVEIGGRVNSVASGGDNDLQNDPANAIRILDAAIGQVSDVRAFLGAFSHDNIEPAIRELSVHIENLQASESAIRDLDFAQETARLARQQVLMQAGVAVVAQANAMPQAVLQLLS